MPESLLRTTIRPLAMFGEDLMADDSGPLNQIQGRLAKAEMLIRKPVAEVFEAFVDPAITSTFWFSRNSGRLAPGTQVTWRRDMYGVSTEVRVTAFEPDKRILVEWGAEDAPAAVEWTFTALSDQTTFVGISNWGFAGDGDAVVKQIIDSAEGFTLVLA